jgi:peptide/nickel transport system substrate-binding protein
MDSITWQSASTRPRRSRRTAFAVSALAVIMLALAGCSGGGNSSSSSGSGGTPQRGGTLVIGRAFDPANLNPFTCACENPSLQTMVQIYDTLTRYAPDATKAPEPSLAERWTVSADSLTYTFTIREAKFSDGSPVTVEDVAYSLGRASAPDSLYGLLYPIANISTPNDTTVVVKLKRVTPAFLYSLGFVASSIVPADVIKKEGDAAFGENPVGSGPFMLEKWVKGQEVDLVRNPNYWREGQPYLDAVTLKYIPNDTTRSLAFQDGSIDVGDEIPYSQIDGLNNSGRGKVTVTQSSSTFAVTLNNAIAPLDDIKVRQALNYATPREAIKKVVFKDLPEIANATAPKLKYWSDSVEPYPLDVAKAKDLMASSSAPNGFTLELTITGTDDASKQTAQILQQAWGEIGVNVEIQEYDFGTVSAKSAASDFEGLMLLPDANTSDLPVPDEFAYLMFGSLKETRNLYSNYVNPEVDALVQKAITTEDEATRADLFQQIQVATHENPRDVPMTFAQYRAAVANEVHGFAYELTGWYYLDNVWLDQ